MSRRLLIVEKSATEAMLLRGILEEAGYRILHATTGEEALEFLAGGDVDMLLTNIALAGVDGYALCARIKADAAWRAIPVLFATRFGDSRDIQRGLQAGADGFIVRPYVGGKVLPQVERAFARAGDGTGALGPQVVSWGGRSYAIRPDRARVANLLCTAFADAVVQTSTIRRHEEDRSAARRAAEQERAGLRSILDRFDAAVAVVAPDGSLVERNQLWDEMAPRVGIPPCAVGGKLLSEWRAPSNVDGGGAEFVVSRLAAVLGGRDDAWTGRAIVAGNGEGEAYTTSAVVVGTGERRAVVIAIEVVAGPEGGGTT